MAYKELKAYADFAHLLIQPSWNKCTVGLEHAVGGDYYWLSSDARFYANGGLELYVFLRSGQEDDPLIIFSTLETQGFKQVKRRFMREWEYYDFERASDSEPAQSSG